MELLDLIKALTQPQRGATVLPQAEGNYIVQSIRIPDAQSGY